MTKISEETRQKVAEALAIEYWTECDEMGLDDERHNPCMKWVSADLYAKDNHRCFLNEADAAISALLASGEVSCKGILDNPKSLRDPLESIVESAYRRGYMAGHAQRNIDNIDVCWLTAHTEQFRHDMDEFLYEAELSLPARIAIRERCAMDNLLGSIEDLRNCGITLKRCAATTPPKQGE